MTKCLEIQALVDQADIAGRRVADAIAKINLALNDRDDSRVAELAGRREDMELRRLSIGFIPSGE